MVALTTLYFAFAFALSANATFTGKDSDMLKTMLSGLYFNLFHSIEQSNVEIAFVPVNVRALSAELCLLAIEYVDGNMIRHEVLDFSQNETHVFLQPHQFKSQETFNLVYEQIYTIESLTSDEFTSNTDCKAIYKRTEDKVFVGEYPDCTQKPGSKYSITITCQGLEVAIPDGHPELKSALPYSIDKLYSFHMEQMPDEDMYMGLCHYKFYME